MARHFWHKTACLLAGVFLAAGPAAGNTDADAGADPEEIAFVYEARDSLPRIAAAAGTTAEDILKNNLLTWSDLRDGQVMRIPAPRGTSLPPALEPREQSSREIWRGVRGRKRIALTFDSGGDPDSGEEILQTLRETKTPATFFTTGAFAAKHPELIAVMARDGHPVYNHSWSHPDLTKLPDEAIVRELQRTDDVVTSITGMATTPYWRPPFGARNRRVLQAATDAGYQSIYWTLDSMDSIPPPKSPDYLVRRILNPPAAKGRPEEWLDGAIILMHVGSPPTARALPAMIAELRAMGFKLVTVSEIIQP